MTKPLMGVQVVVIEADPPSAKLAALLLRDAGADVATAFDAEQALRLVDLLHPRAVVISLELPVISGLVLARHISQLSWAQQTVIVGVSTGNGEQARLDAVSHGCTGYLVKPIDERLVETISSLLGGTK